MVEGGTKKSRLMVFEAIADNVLSLLTWADGVGDCVRFPEDHQVGIDIVVVVTVVVDVVVVDVVDVVIGVGRTGKNVGLESDLLEYPLCRLG